MPAIGIDLGTTKSCVGVWKNGNVEIIHNDHGNRLTASYVAFTKTERLVGDAAKNQAALNPKNTIFNVKRLIGRKINSVEDFIENCPFTVYAKDENAEYEVSYKEETKQFTPEELSSMVLTKMKEVAENFLKTSVTDAVVTVPACFNDSQRQATKDAGRIAGLNILRILSEPTAAAITYAFEKKMEGERTVLIFDLGGGTCDVSILAMTDAQNFEVKVSSGNTCLGGEDFDNRIVNYFIEEIKKTHKTDVSQNGRIIIRLRKEAERVKRILSSGPMASIEIDSLHEDVDFQALFTRDKFESLCEDLFESVLAPVEDALRSAAMDKSDIHDVLLVGGSTRIPKIQSMLQDFFDGKVLTMNMNAEEAVAYGAAVLAANLSDVSGNLKPTFNIDEVTPFPLVLDFEEIRKNEKIDKGSLIPFIKEIQFTPITPKLKIQIYEDIIFERNVLGNYELMAIPGRQIQITFQIDYDRIFSITAKDGAQNVAIKSQKGRLSKQEIEKRLAETKRFKVEDNEKQNQKIAREQFEIDVFQIKRDIERSSCILTESTKQAVKQRCNDSIRWLDGNHMATVEDYEEKIEKLRQMMKGENKTVLLNGQRPLTRNQTNLTNRTSKSTPKNVCCIIL